jgi:peptide-methionine (S)-S-oxide reductase
LCNKHRAERLVSLLNFTRIRPNSVQLNIEPMSESSQSENTAQATFGAGCFWCVEAVFSSLKGVRSVQSGYSGGHIKNPSYREVCNGNTGHAEVVRITFNPQEISYDTLLEVFFQTHDPTTLNRQGNDVGTQYRSVIFYHDEEQKHKAELARKAADESGTWPHPVVTAVEQLTNYYPAEDYHQNYFALNSDQPYCAAVIRPKMEKFRKHYADMLKAAAHGA